MKLSLLSRLFLLLLVGACGCKDSQTSLQVQSNPLIGTWKCLQVFVDTLDPEHTFLPVLYLKSDDTFEETARFQELPSGVVHGYKYVKSGSYTMKADTLIFSTQGQVYLSFADSLQPKPTPVPITPYLTKVRFRLLADSLAFIKAGTPNDTSAVWYRTQ